MNEVHAACVFPRPLRPVMDNYFVVTHSRAHPHTILTAAGERENG